MLIPRTSPQLYISGICALRIMAWKRTKDPRILGNIWKTHSPEASATLWLKLAGCGAEINTNPILGDDGVCDIAETLDLAAVERPEGPCMAAGFARACADMALAMAFEGRMANFLLLRETGINEEETAHCHAMLERAMPFLDPAGQDSLLRWKAMQESAWASWTESLNRHWEQAEKEARARQRR